MKSISLKLLLLIFGLIMHLTSFAYDVEVNGIYYNIIEKVKVAEVTYKGSKFYEYKSYSGNVQIPSQITYLGNVYRVTSIGKDAFRNCSDLITISIGESIEKIEDDAFWGCQALTKVNATSLNSWLKIDFSNRLSNPLTNAHHFFIGGIEVVDLVIPQNIKEIKNEAFCNGSSIKSVTFHNSLTSIGYYAFEGCTGLTTIKLPQSVIALHGGAFSKCTNLVSVNIPNGTNTIEGRTFYGCSKLSSITIPESVEHIGNYAFSGCSSLTGIRIPNSVKEIEGSAFWGCGFKYVDIGSLESWCKIKFQDADSTPLESAHKLLINGEEKNNIVIPDGITKINNYAFRGCENLKSITIPNSVTEIGALSFCDCLGLSYIVIPNSVKIIDYRAFWGCTGLSSITLSNSLKTISESLFYKCSNLKAITIPNSVELIEEKAFYGCTNLTTVIIGNNVKRVLNEAFCNCSNLESFICDTKTVPELYTNVFLGSYVNYATLFVPQVLQQQFESNYKWNIFGAIKTLSDYEPYKNIAAADAVIAKINAIGKVEYTDACKGKIDAANKAYNALTADQKALVTNLDVLTTAKHTYDSLKAAADKLEADKAKANAVVAKINAIGTVEYTDVCKGKIDEASNAYNALTADQKALVSNLDVLTTAQQTYESLKAAAEKLAADKSAFDKYKSEQKAIIETLVKEDDSDAVKEIIKKAISDIDALGYEEAISLDDNKVNINSFVTSVNEAVEKQRAEDQKTTGIEELEFAEKANIYDLNGRKITSSMLKSGLYIRNGKKIVVK